jgi:hypothetical protein
MTSVIMDLNFAICILMNRIYLRKINIRLFYSSGGLTSASHRGGSEFDPCGNLRFVVDKVVLQQVPFPRFLDFSFLTIISPLFDTHLSQPHEMCVNHDRQQHC